MNLAKVYVMSVTHKPDDPLGLGSLPPVSPPDDGWPVIEATLTAKRRQRRRTGAIGGAFAVAATVVMALSVTLWRPGDTPAIDPAATAQHDAASESVPEPLRDPPLESLIAMSKQLESRVRLYRNEIGDLPASDLVYQVELQDLIVQVDEQLSMDPGSLNLWSQRVDLLLDVTQLYENQLRRDYYRIASL